MRYLSIGYYLSCFSPVLSMILFFVGSGFVHDDWLFSIIMLTVVHMSVMGVQILGLVLFFVGHRKGESIPFKEWTIFFSVFLILWGSLVSFGAIGWYNELLEWSRLPEVRNLTIWDHMEYATWALKGLLWIASGLIFIGVSYFQSSKSKLQKPS